MQYKRIFALVVLMVIAFSGCSNIHANPLAVADTYITDVANDGILSAELTSIWNIHDEINENAPAQCSVVFEGIEYHGEYQRSVDRDNLPYATDYYLTSDGFDIMLNGDTGEFRGIAFMGRDYFETVMLMDDIPDSEDYALETAKRIAAKYINIQDYEIELEPDEYTQQINGQEYSMTFYPIHFVKRIGDLPTSDFVYISISSKGDIVTCQLGDIGKFDDLRNNDIPFADIEDALRTKVQNMYGKHEKYTFISYQTKNQKLRITPDGDYCVVTEIVIDLRDQAGIEFSTGLRMAVTLK